MYQQLGVDGLRGLANYNVDSKVWLEQHVYGRLIGIFAHLLLQRWGQAHSRVSRMNTERTDDVLTTWQAHFAILNWLLKDGGDCVIIEHNKTAGTLAVKVDRGKVASHGKPALGRMLLHLHMYRCTADVQACREYYEMLSRLTDEHLEWRKVVVTSKPPPLVFVHANTCLKGDGVILREYEPTVEGLIQSWAERRI